ncbi:MAG TPA: helix-turn-helix domain-containing GNAT family N-acetyltransferase, partial [Vicinamibacterales bacterium]|nr:helix-turn-helix domain-containing GNAT family N-acetyltransferase [Vicinamibacterales bacterium]
DHVAQVRQFNRLVTQRVGALDDHFLGRDRPLGASRLLYEIGERGADLRELRRRLGLDAGYVSRLIKALIKEGLIRLVTGAGDQRVRTAQLTARGRHEMRELNTRSDRLAEGLLEAVTPKHRERLVAAMAEVQRLLRAAGVVIERVDPASAAARWCWRQYFAELDRRFPGGFDPGTSLPVDDRDLVPPHGAFLVASIDGETVAGGCVKTIAPRVGYLKRMWVAETARGLGLGRRMLEALEDETRALGLTRLRLETNKTLKEAIALYRSAGFRDVPPFNDEPYATHWFEKRLRRSGVR